MNTANFSTVATQVIDGFDANAHKAIDAWREGHERFGQFTSNQWDAAFKKSSPQLSAETRKNATHAKKVFGGYYNKGVAMSASGATVAIDTMVQAARVAVDRAVTWQQSRA